MSEQDQMRRLTDFVAKYCRNRNRHLSVEDIGRAYLRKGKQQKVSRLMIGKLNQLRETVHLLSRFDIPTRVRMLFVMQIPVAVAFLKKLRRTANVLIDENSQIVGYQAFDGSLKLGDVDSEDVHGSESPEELDSEDVIYVDDSEWSYPSSPIRCVKQEKKNNWNQMLWNMSPLKLEEPEDDMDAFGTPSESPSGILRKSGAGLKSVDRFYDFTSSEDSYTSGLIPTSSSRIQKASGTNLASSEQWTCIEVPEDDMDDIEYFDTFSEAPSAIPEASGTNSSRTKNWKYSKSLGSFGTSFRDSYTSGLIPSLSSRIGESSGANWTPSESSESIEVKKYLNILHCLILTLDTPQLSEIERKFQKSISESSRKILIEDVMFSLEAIFRIVTLHSSSSENVDDLQNPRISVKMILKLLMNVVFYLESHQTSELLAKIRRRIELNGNFEKTVPIETVQRALETALLPLHHNFLS